MFFQGQLFLTSSCTEPCVLKHYIRLQKWDQKLRWENWVCWCQPHVDFFPCHHLICVLVLLPFPCEALGLTLMVDLDVSLFSDFLSTAPSFGSPCSPHPWGLRSCTPALTRCHPSSSSLSRSLPFASTSITSSAYLLLTPVYYSTAPASPWLLIRPWYLPPMLLSCRC